jgi:Activator of Hsp90 ATPase homolog 1-like protein
MLQRWLQGGGARGRATKEKIVPTMNDSSAEPASDRAIVTTRVLDAPRELVFKAWSDRDHLAHWWGPKGFTNTFHEFDS